jgi:hypothetical protein
MIAVIIISLPLLLVLLGVSLGLGLESHTAGLGLRVKDIKPNGIGLNWILFEIAEVLILQVRLMSGTNCHEGEMTIFQSFSQEMKFYMLMNMTRPRWLSPLQWCRLCVAHF